MNMQVAQTQDKTGQDRYRHMLSLPLFAFVLESSSLPRFQNAAALCRPAFWRLTWTWSC